MRVRVLRSRRRAEGSPRSPGALIRNWIGSREHWGWSRLGCVWRVGPTKSMSSKTSIQPEALSQQLRSHEVTMPIAAITGAFRAINDLSLLMARIAMPNGNGLVWRKKATFFT